MKYFKLLLLFMSLLVFALVACENKGAQESGQVGAWDACLDGALLGLESPDQVVAVLSASGEPGCIAGGAGLGDAELVGKRHHLLGGGAAGRAGERHLERHGVALVECAAVGPVNPC